MTDTLNKNPESCTGYRTPETDAQYEATIDEPFYICYYKMTQLCKMLERERDAYWEQADDLILLLGKTQERMFDAERERDEAIKMLEEYSLNVSDDDLKILTDSNRMGAINMVSAKREIRRREIVNRIKKQEP